jgi:hypothetical protein
MTFWGLKEGICRAYSKKHGICIYYKLEKEKFYGFEKKKDLPVRPYV